MDNSRIQESIDQSIQNRKLTDISYGQISLLAMLAKASDIVSPWWSRRRDTELRNFYHSSDALSGAMYNLVAKMTTIPVKVVARDKSIKSHVAMAETYTDIIQNGSQFGEGWMAFYGRFLEDLYGQDNGAFAEVIGPGDPAGPLEGAVYSLAHLDSARCIRTGNPLYPVIFESPDGKLRKLHFTRVMFSAQMPSPRMDMNGVGFCAVSRVLNASQNLMDISTYKQEKLGSRPARQMMITGGGLDPEDIKMAFSVAERSMDAVGLSRFSKTIVAGNRNIPDPKLQQVDLASVPDGFDEKESTILGMAVIAMGFGIDARELFPAMESGATKADAIVQHVKQRGKAPGQTIQMTENMVNTKALPPYLALSFDYQDDQQDRQVAEIQSVRAQSRERDLGDKVTDVRTERERMVEVGEITEAQFEQLELADGRLEDGISVEVLFYTDDKNISAFLSGVTDANYKDKVLDIMKEIANSRDKQRIKDGRKAIAAIKYRYRQQEMMEEAAFQQALMPQPQTPGSTATKVDDTYQDEKFGRKLPRQTVRLPDEEQNYQEAK